MCGSLAKAAPALNTPCSVLLHWGPGGLFVLALLLDNVAASPAPWLPEGPPRCLAGRLVLGSAWSMGCKQHGLVVLIADLHPLSTKL